MEIYLIGSPDLFTRWPKKQGWTSMEGTKWPNSEVKSFRPKGGITGQIGWNQSELHGVTFCSPDGIFRWNPMTGWIHPPDFVLRVKNRDWPLRSRPSASPIPVFVRLKQNRTLAKSTSYEIKWNQVTSIQWPLHPGHVQSRYQLPDKTQISNYQWPPLNSCHLVISSTARVPFFTLILKSWKRVELV